MAKPVSKTPTLDIDAIVSKYKDLKRKGTGSGEFLKLEDGETRVRVIPFVREETGQAEVFIEFRQHAINKKFFTCPTTEGKPCPICEASDKFYQAKEKEISKELNAKTRFLFVVLHEGKLKVMEVGANVTKGITKYFADADYSHFTDLNAGHDMKINKSGAGLDTEYDVIIAPKPTAVKLTEDPKDPSNTIKSVLSYKELQAVVASHYELPATGEEAVVEEEEETEAEILARLKAEAKARLAKGKPAPSTGGGRKK